MTLPSIWRGAALLLSGSRFMPIAYSRRTLDVVRGLFFATLSGLSFMASSAATLPRLDDPQLQALLNTLSGEYEQYLASGKVHLSKPAESKPWPCDMTSAQLNQLAGIVDSDDDPIAKRKLALDARLVDAKPGKIVYKNKVFYPVQAACKDAKLRGLVEFWVEFDLAFIDPSSATYTYRYLRQVRFVAKNGEPSGVVLKIDDLLKQTDQSSNPAEAATTRTPISVNFSAEMFDEPLSMSKLTVGLNHQIDVTSSKVNVYVNTIRPFNGNRHETTQYGFFGDSTHKDSTTRFKDGKKHGLEVRYPGKTGAFPIPASQTCWEDGQKIMTNSCTVD